MRNVIGELINIYWDINKYISLKVNILSCFDRSSPYWVNNYINPIKMMKIIV